MPFSSDHAPAAALARFFARAGRLKTTPRTGWLDRGVPPVHTESVADHSFAVALMAWLTAGPELDRDRVLKLALLHDLAEAVIGDLTPYAPAELPGEHAVAERRAFLNGRHPPDAERAAAKHRAEAAAFARMTAELPDTARTELAALWAELEARQSPEARFVKQIDRLETYLQSRAYAAADPALPVASFAAEVAAGVTHPDLTALRDAIAALAGAGYDTAVGEPTAGGPANGEKSNLMS